MKARAWFFTLLIGMISLVGFGNVTADLDQNSETDVGISIDITSVNVATLEIQFNLLEFTAYHWHQCFRTVRFGDSINLDTPLQSISFKEDLQVHYNYRQHIQHRRARDGITNPRLLLA